MERTCDCWRTDCCVLFLLPAMVRAGRMEILYFRALLRTAKDRAERIIKSQQAIQRRCGPVSSLKVVR